MRSHDWLDLALHNWGRWIESDYSGIIPRKHCRGTLGNLYISPGNRLSRPLPEHNTQAELINASYWLLKRTKPQEALIINYKYVIGFRGKGLSKVTGLTLSTCKRRTEEAKISIRQLYYSIGQ